MNLELEFRINYIENTNKYKISISFIQKFQVSIKCDRLIFLGSGEAAIQIPSIKSGGRCGCVCVAGEGGGIISLF